MLPHLEQRLSRHCKLSHDRSNVPRDQPHPTQRAPSTMRRSTRLRIAWQDESHWRFSNRASRQSLPPAEQAFASYELQVGCRSVEIALTLKLLNEAECTHHRYVCRTRQLRRVAVLAPG